MKEPILNAGLTLQFAVLAFHLVGGLLGYWIPKVTPPPPPPPPPSTHTHRHTGPTTGVSSLCQESCARFQAMSLAAPPWRDSRPLAPLSQALNFGETTCRTMAIETAMKSSAFGFLLAKLHFSAFLTRVPSAVSVVWMAVTGSALAVFWKYCPVDEAKEVGKR